MRSYGFIIVVQIIRVCSASKIYEQNDNEHLQTVAANIVNRCFESAGRWSELLIVPDRASSGILEKIHQESKTTNSIVFLDVERNDDRLTDPGKCNNYFNTSFEWWETKTTAVMITTHSVKHLEYVLCFIKNNIQKLWRPRSPFLIVLDTRCNVAECNNMFKVMWNYWILNAVILCSSNKSLSNRHLSEIELYNFNPYSADHPQQWETIIHETVEVSISTGNFNHSWYIFKQTFTEITSFDDCGDIFFDKTSNLDGYVIPISVGDSLLLSGKSETASEKWLTSVGHVVKTMADSLRFDFVEVFNNDTDKFGQRGFINGSYAGVLKDIYTTRAHFCPVSLGVRHTPGLESTYPHDGAGGCLASHIVGNQPQWTNFANARHIWISLGLGVLFTTVILYLQNKSHGIVSALLDAQRLMIGNSIIRTSSAIKHRLILGSMLLVVLVIDGAIRGRFISILTVVRPYPNIDTLEQLRGLDVDIYAPEAFEELTRDPKGKARFHITFDLEPCIETIQLGERHRVCLTECQLLSYHTSNLAVLHKSSASISTIPMRFLTALHWPMTDRYSFEVQKLVESGISRKWKLDSARDAEVEGWKQSRASEAPFVRPTKLNDLLPAFMLFFVGLSIAMMVFAWEMKAWKYLRRVKFWKLNSSLQ